MLHVHFSLTEPSTTPIPVLVEVPHAGLSVPEGLEPRVEVTTHALRRDADIYVDDLYADAPHVGAHLLSAHVSRYIVDLNRAASDIDPQSIAQEDVLAVLGPGRSQASLGVPRPRGVIWAYGTDGRAVLKRPLTGLELESRIREFHSPYHAALRQCLEALRNRFGYALLIAAHSMPSLGRTAGADGHVRRADIVPGTQGRSTAAAVLIDALDGHFRGRGYQVSHDDPYRGGFSTRHYGDPASGIHAIQIELNRDLYVDEANFTRLTDRFARLKTDLTDLIAVLGATHP